MCRRRSERARARQAAAQRHAGDAEGAWAEAGPGALAQLRAAVALDARRDWNAALAHALLFGASAAAEGLAPPGDALAAHTAWDLPMGAARARMRP